MDCIYYFKQVDIKRLLFLMLLFSFNIFFAQTAKRTILGNDSIPGNGLNNILVLEKPHFTSPEKETLFFLSETYFFDLHNYFGNVKKVQKVHSIYNPAQAIVSSDTVFFESNNPLLKNLDISIKPILDRIGIDSIFKKTDTIQLFHFDEEASYVYQIYELKNEQIINSSESTSVLYYTTDYTYNKNQKLIKIATTDDYGLEKIETATYTKTGDLETKSSFDTNDGITVTKIEYTYKNKLLTKLNKKEVLYFVPFEIEKTSIDKIAYSKYQNDETFINENTLSFEYTKNKKLNKLVEISTGYSKKDGVRYKNVQTFSLTYQSNRLTICANLPEKRIYEYILDTFKNPREINSYVVEKDRTWLHKKTTFKILYDE